jgi:hypothetical protein
LQAMVADAWRSTTVKSWLNATSIRTAVSVDCIVVVTLLAPHNNAITTYSRAAICGVIEKVPKFAATASYSSSTNSTYTAVGHC